MIFEPTLTLGALLNFLGILAVGLVYLVRMEGKMNVLALRITTLETAVIALASTDKRISVVENMVSVVQREISDLRRGAGWITRDRTSVDGEYP